MSMRFACALCIVVALTAGATTLAAPVQERPGQMTQARVWVENRGKNEAVPITLQEVETQTPINVQVTGVPTVSIVSASTVPARFVRQAWEYRAMNIAAGQDAATLLAGAGADGWEATGAQLPGQSGITLLLKRPR